MFQRRGSGTVPVLCTRCSTSQRVERALSGAPFGVCRGKGSSTFSLRWIRVKGMLCLSWGLLFLVSCWMGSAMSATEPHSSHVRLQKQHWDCASFPGAASVRSSLGKEKAFPRRAHLCCQEWVSLSHSLNFQLPKCPWKAFGCAPFPGPVQGVFPIPATLVLLDSGVSTWTKLGWLLSFTGSRKYCCVN